MKSILIYLLAVFSLLAGQKPEKVSLQLDWYDQFQFAGCYIAKEKGFYKDVGLDVNIISYKKRDNVLKKVLSNQVQYAIGRSSLLIDAANDRNITLLAAIFQSSPFVLIARKSSGIKDIKDLKNKRFILGAAEKSAPILAMLHANHIFPKNIMLLKNPKVDKIKNFISGKVDVISVYKSNQLYILKKKFNDIIVFDPATYGFDFYSDILYTSGMEVAKHRQRVKKFKDASLRGWRYAFSHIKESVDLIYKKYNTQHKTKDALLYEAKVLKKLAYYKTEYIGYINKNKIEKIYDIYNVMGYTKKRADYDKLIFSEYDSSIKLTDREKKYLKKHPVLFVANTENFPPFNYNVDGKAKGFSIDYINLLARKLHVRIKYISNYSRYQYLKLLRAGKIDIIPNIIKSKEREKYIGFTDGYYTTQTVIYTNVHSDNIDDIGDLKFKKVAVVKGSLIEYNLKKYFPSIKRISVHDQLEALNFLSKGKVDAVIGSKEVLSFLIRQKNIPNIKISSYIKSEGTFKKLRLGVSKSNKELKDILSKAEKSIDKNKLIKLEQKWFGYYNFINTQAEWYFTKTEKEYLKKRSSIRVCINPNVAPIEFWQNDTPNGISIDTVKIVASRLNLKLDFIKTKTWSQSQKFLKEKKCDILPATAKTEERLKYANFTKPYLIYKLAIITKKDKPIVTDLKSITNNTMSRNKGSGLISLLKKRYPKLKIIETTGYKQSFEYVLNDKVYFTIATLPVLSYYKAKYDFSDLQIAGYTNMVYNLSIAVRKDDRILLNTINKALSSISPDTQNIIYQKWTTVKYVDRYHSKAIIITVMLSMFVLFIILYLYMRQKKFKDKLENLNLSLKNKIEQEVEKNRLKDQKLFEQSRLAQMGEMLSMIAHQWRQPLCSYKCNHG